MSDVKKDKGLHPRNKHNDNYDFDALVETSPELKQYVKKNQYGTLTIDFAEPKAVLALNRALLAHFYGVTNWSIPKNYLTPPIPGRADYLHYMADLLAKDGIDSENVTVLDIGTGANCIYPIIGASTYNWKFVGTDIDTTAINCAQQTADTNEILKGKITTRLQDNVENIFNGIILKDDKFAFTMCNPPFHKNRREATKGNHRKVKNLSKDKQAEALLNFGGQANELWYSGGEINFITKMIKQSVQKAPQVIWFSTLVSKKENLKVIYDVLRSVEAKRVETIKMKQGNKETRIVAWSFQEGNKSKI
jgi:23S rRNA (adenine1618-N6)-methyltransferase